MADQDNIKAEIRTVIDKAKAEARNFDINAILRGAQLTIVGALRALQNPKLFEMDIYRQAAVAVAAGVVIRVLVEIPVLLAKISIWMLSFMVNLESASWDNTVLEGLDFITNVVLQVPFFLMNIRQLIPIGPSLDEMFMVSLEWVDFTYMAKHKSENPDTLRSMYHANLKQYPTKSTATKQHRASIDAFLHLISRFGRRAALSLGVYLLSFLPLIGRFVLPAASFYTFHKAVGPVPAGAIFAVGTLLPRRYLAIFLQSYFASRSLTRELVSCLSALCESLLTTSSSNRTSRGFNLPKNSRNNSSKTARVCSSALALDSIYC